MSLPLCCKVLNFAYLPIPPGESETNVSLVFNHLPPSFQRHRPSSYRFNRYESPGRMKKKKNKEEEEEEKKGKSKLGYFRSQICAQFIEWMGCLRIACETVHTFNPFTLRRIVCWRKIDNPYLETIVRGISYECL